MTKTFVYAQARVIRQNLVQFLRWSLTALIAGLFIGTVGSLFGIALEWAADFREANSWALYFLPIGGITIVAAYQIAKIKNPRGTNFVIDSIRSEEKPPLVMAPLIFSSTFVTHLCGGSAGREGAALQLGGSLGSFVGKLSGVDERGKNVAVMCGMSAAFAALFGTPVAATVFSLELISVGIMHYSALVPCAISSVTACGVARWFGLSPEGFSIAGVIPQTNLADFIRVIALGVLCAVMSIIMCVTLHRADKLYQLIKNRYLRIVLGGAAVVCITMLIGTRDYLGAGMPIIETAIQEGTARPFAFLMKLILTALTLGAGYRGGEIVPTFFIGATFGCVIGPFLGLPPAFSAAIAMTSLFCGVTNCPITSLLIAFELFGFKAPAYFLIAIAVSYALSGYYSLYSAQKIVYDKLETRYINRDTHA